MAWVPGSYFQEDNTDDTCALWFTTLKFRYGCKYVCCTIKRLLALKNFEMAARHFHYFHTPSNTSLGCCTDQHFLQNCIPSTQLNSKKDIQILSLHTTLQSIMNAKLSKQRFWHCYENGLIKTIQTIPHNLFVIFKLTSLYCGLRLILVYPNPQ